jgi:hypothetical protein
MVVVTSPKKIRVNPGLKYHWNCYCLSTWLMDRNKINQYVRFAILCCFIIYGGLSELLWDPFDAVIDDLSFIIGLQM